MHSCCRAYNLPYKWLQEHFHGKWKCVEALGVHTVAIMCSWRGRQAMIPFILQQVVGPAQAPQVQGAIRPLALNIIGWQKFI